MSDDPILLRIAQALERIAPPVAPPADLIAHPAYLWDGRRIDAVEGFAPLDFALLTGIDAQKAVLLDNSRRLALGHAAHDALLWGARGTGKSASVAAVVGALQGEGLPIALVQAASEHLDSLPALFAQLRGVDRAFILFIDDLGFDDAGAGAGSGVGAGARSLRSMLEGGASARPRNVRLYVTANRRHIVPRHMAEQEDPIAARDVLDDKLALADRFGLSLGFHAMDQDAYVAIVRGYAQALGLSFAPLDAIQWATQRGSRSGRVAWQYVVELAGRAGKAL